MAKITIEVPDSDIPLSEVPPILAKVMGTNPVSRQTIYTYADTGKMGPKGERVFLEVEHKDGRYVTSLVAIKAFVEELSS